jgi:outer membrane lipoprotein-sorting protein
MSMLMRHPGLRWVVPAGVAVAVIGGGAATRAVAASADPTLPPRSAAQLLVDLQGTRVDALSGTVVQRSDLGLPSLPSIGGSGSSSLTSLLTGSHTLRVWYSGPDKARVALVGTLGETDVIASGRDVWTWDSQQNTATHQVLPADKPGASKPSTPTTLPSTPQQAADLALSALDPTTSVTTAGSARVAGRSAYELVLAPKDTTSLIGQVRIALDSQRHVPVRVQVFSHNADAPAFEIAFTQVNFTRPDAAQFTFNPPPGVTVKQPSPDTTSPEKQGTPSQRPTVIGTGWTSVVVAPATDLTSAGSGVAGSPSAGSGNARADAGSITAILDKLPKVSGSWGSGRVLSGKLFTVLLTDDGRVLAGAVSQDRLTQVAADPAAALKATK